MCWKTRREDCLERLVADKPLTTFKILIKGGISGLYSYYQSGYYWKEGEVNSLERELSLVKVKDSSIYYGYIKEGFHSYSPDGVYLREDHRKVEIASPNYYTLDWFLLGEARLVLAKCEIPEGATYYKNEDGEIVSDKIIVEEVESLEDYILDQETQARWGMRVALE